jgi:chorismate synthase
VSTLRMITAGESHGACEVCVVEGVPAGLSLTTAEIDHDLARRQQGYGRGGRQTIEADSSRLVAGVRLGRTLGSPICIVVENKDHANWIAAMSAEAQAGGTRGDEPSDTVPRPGHADLSGVSKYGFTEIRSVLERASARETVARVAGGAVCRRLLRELGISVHGRVLSIGTVGVEDDCDFSRPDEIDWAAVEVSPVGCHDPEASAGMCEAIDQAREAGESLGGIFEVWCWGLCPGVGGYASMETRLDGRLLGALGSIPAIKGVELGAAFKNAGRLGSQVHDPLVVKSMEGKSWIARESNRAAGIEGGMTTGMPVVLRVAMKPIPTLTTPLPSVDLRSLKPHPAQRERSDIAAVSAARVVGEAMVAYVIAGAYREKFGGDSLAEMLASVSAYQDTLEDRGLWHRS